MSAARRKSGANEALFKLIMIGDSGTGKSCLLVRYIKDEFSEDYKVTIGVEFASKKLDIDENYKIKLQIWDTAGQESFRSIVKSFYRNSAAVILVYDITRKSSFQSLQQWLNEARENTPKNAIFVLMGTHLDLQDERQVNKEEAEQWMKKQEIALYFETSAKTSLNVSLAFDQIAKQLFMNQLQKKKRESRVSKLTPMPQSVSLKQPTQTEKSKDGCC